MSKINHKTKDIYVQYGAGNIAIEGWLNFDASPTLRLQKIPIIGRIFKKKIIFDKNILFGDIVKGLPIKPNSIQGLFASHVLEHLAYDDAITTLKNSFTMLKPGGCFRLIVPDLQFYLDNYNTKLSTNGKKRKLAAYEFNLLSGLGRKESLNSLFARFKRTFGNSSHLWMWDYPSLAAELKKVGFINISKFRRGSSKDKMFLKPERDYQFSGSIGNYGLCIQAYKPFKES
tara:strand:+ start:1144 stop:1833 length:690 start_codon:yes stop_codon:yes gene_type:complete